MLKIVFVALLFVGALAAPERKLLLKGGDNKFALEQVLATADDTTKKFLCDICEYNVERIEEYISEEGNDNLDKVIEDCIAHVSKGTNKGFAKFVCDTLFGDNVKPILKQLKDPLFRKAEAQKVCRQMSLCQEEKKD